MVAEMFINARRQVNRAIRFYPALMRSHARLTYTKVGKNYWRAIQMLRERYTHQLTTIETCIRCINLIKKGKRDQRRGPF